MINMFKGIKIMFDHLFKYGYPLGHNYHSLEIVNTKFGKRELFRCSECGEYAYRKLNQFVGFLLR